MSIMNIKHFNKADFLGLYDLDEHMTITDYDNIYASMIYLDQSNNIDIETAYFGDSELSEDSDCITWPIIDKNGHSSWHLYYYYNTSEYEID